jgi:dTDP-4-dehydrorhamnose 3,5-epimerase-like enzyme
MSIGKIEYMTLEPKIDYRGSLIPFYFSSFKDFKAKRLFWIENVPTGVIRGGHAHHKAKQVLICMRGTIEVEVDDGVTQGQIVLGQNVAACIPELTWTSMKFLEKDSILLVLSSEEHTNEDYIRDHKKFCIIVKERQQ